MQILKSKLKNNKGSALILVIFAMMMIIATMGMVSLQLNNQIISNKNTGNQVEAKYLAEAGVEKTIADIYKAIEDNLYNLDKETKPKSYADNYIAYCLRESKKYFIRANENMPSGHKDIIDNQILKIYYDEKLIEKAVPPYTNIGSNISKVLGGVNNLKSQTWYKGVTNNHKKGIGDNVDRGEYYLKLAQETLNHMYERNNISHIPHTKGSIKVDENKIIYLSQPELIMVINNLDEIRSSISLFEDDPSQSAGNNSYYKDGTLNKKGVLIYVDDIKKDISNMNNDNLKLNDTIVKLNTLKEAIQKLRPKKGVNQLNTTKIDDIRNILIESQNYLSNKELLAKSSVGLSEYIKVIEGFQESPGKSKLVTKSQVIIRIEDINKALNITDINTGSNDVILKLNNILDRLVELQIDVTNLKPKGNANLPSISQIDNIKKYIIEIKCNLGKIDYISSEEKIIGPLEEPPVYREVIIPKYTYSINGKDVYTRESLKLNVNIVRDRYEVRDKKTNLIIRYEYIIREIRPITENIIAYDSKNRNKINANVTFYIAKLNSGSKYIVYDHKVNYWDKINN